MAMLVLGGVLIEENGVNTRIALASLYLRNPPPPQAWISLDPLGSFAQVLLLAAVSSPLWACCTIARRAVGLYK